MIIQAPSPVGIDFKLQKLQSDLHAHLISQWSLNANLSTDYACYDRCYRNQTKNGFTPEVYQSNGNYKEVLFDDKVKAFSFFGVGNNIEYKADSNGNIVDVHLIFMVNLESLKGSGRKDEEARQDVQLFLQHELYGFQLKGIQIGIDNVFNEYSGFEPKIKYRDLNPFHCFRFNFTTLYHFTDHQCT